ncbi:MAG: exosome complex component, partial [Methanolobus sp.]|nr:exosome complex component [Methanolobus sp.]
IIDVFAEVLQADAGTRTAAINAACVALADAGIPMKGLVSACAVGKVDGQLVLDLNKPEDNYGDADIPMAMTSDGEITLVQMDGDVTPEEFKKAIEMCKEGCRQIMEIQKETLRSKFTKLEDVDISDDEEVDVSSIVESALESSENDVEDEEEAEVESGDADQEDEVEDADEDLDDEPESEDDEDEDLDSVESHSDFEAVELVEDFEESFTDVDEEDATEDEDDEEKD